MAKHLSGSDLDISKLKVGDIVVDKADSNEHMADDTICMNSGYAQLDKSHDLVSITRHTLVGKNEMTLSKEEICALYNSFCR